MKNEKKFIDCLELHINNRLEQSKIKITDLVLEELITFALEDSDNTYTYNSGSHTAGRDIEALEDNASVKSAKVTKDILEMSSFRLSRYKNNLPNMIEFIDNEGKNFEYYYVLARNENKEKISYSFYILPSNIFESKSMTWEEYKSGWRTTDDSHVKLRIVKNMSSQLWITLKLKNIEKYIKFKIDKEISTLGEKRYKANL